MTLEERERHIREIAQRLAERLAAEWPAGEMTINDIEDLAERLGHDVQREISERFLRDEAARKEGNRTACPCGGGAAYRRYHPLTVVTAAGRLEVRRAYYYCDRCRKGRCPADGRLGLGPANTTPTAQARLAVLSALSPYVQVADLVAQLGLSLQVDLKSTERVAQALAQALHLEHQSPKVAVPELPRLSQEPHSSTHAPTLAEARGALVDLRSLRGDLDPRVGLQRLGLISNPSLPRRGLPSAGLLRSRYRRRGKGRWAGSGATGRAVPAERSVSARSAGVRTERRSVSGTRGLSIHRPTHATHSAPRLPGEARASAL
jgi:hypothetical protein